MKTGRDSDRDKADYYASRSFFSLKCQFLTFLDTRPLPQTYNISVNPWHQPFFLLLGIYLTHLLFVIHNWRSHTLLTWRLLAWFTWYLPCLPAVLSCSQLHYIPGISLFTYLAFTYFRGSHLPHLPYLALWWLTSHSFNFPVQTLLYFTGLHSPTYQRLLNLPSTFVTYFAWRSFTLHCTLLAWSSSAWHSAKLSRDPLCLPSAHLTGTYIFLFKYLLLTSLSLLLPILINYQFTLFELISCIYLLAFTLFTSTHVISLFATHLLYLSLISVTWRWLKLVALTSLLTLLTWCSLTLFT